MPARKQQLKEQFCALQEAMSVSGHEQEVIQRIYRGIKPHVDAVHLGPLGTLVAVKKGDRPGPAVMVSAHMDEIGYMVKNILPNGFLTVGKVGFPTDQISMGRKVWVSSKRIPGVLGIKPSHLATPEEAGRVTPINKTYLDMGCSSAEEVRAMGIRIGDPVIIQSDIMEMHNPDLLCGRAVDNRICCAIIMELFKNLDPADFGGTLYGVFTVREEQCFKGAEPAVEEYAIDYGFVLDTIPVSDTPDCNAASELPIFLGKGPGFPVVEAAFDSFQICHPAVRDIVEQTAKTCDVNLQYGAYLPGYLTDSVRMAYAGKGLPLGTIAVPRRYSHSPVEMMHLSDAVDAMTLLEKIIERNEHADITFVQLKD